MLNVGKLGPGAAEYYIGEIATSAEDYYTGHGENAGRWVGSLAPELGLSGEVDPEHFRHVLNGKHPHTGEYLVTAQGSAARAAKRRSRAPATVDVPEHVDPLRAAAQLGVSARYVRRLLAEGERYAARLAAASQTDQAVPEPTAYLRGERVESANNVCTETWLVARTELERFALTRRRPKVRPGYDLTLRPPKSVSVLWALADHDHRRVIRRAHAEAVDEVVRYYESRAVFARRGSGDRHLVNSVGIVAAAFDHRTSRAGDPLLHTHVVTANMTCTTGRDGLPRWRAIAGTGLYEHARAAGHLYQAHLRHLLARRLGVTFTPVVNGYAEVDGVPDDVIAAFSKRRREIEEVLAESESRSARAAQVATLETREAKDYSVDAETLERRWRAEAAALGFTPDAIASCFDHKAPERHAPAVFDRLFDALAGPHGLTERAATFTRTDVIEAIASAVGASATAPQIEGAADRFLASECALLVDRTSEVQASTAGVRSVQASVRRSRTQKMYTTPELARLEAQLLEWGTAAPHAHGGVDTATVETVIAARPELSSEQRTMVRAACSAGEFLQPIAGRPGAGKTYATEAIVAAHVAAGVPIVGCAVSATAAAELESAAGFARSTGAPAMTVARLLLDVDDPRVGLLPGTVVVVDEASMLGTRDLHHLATRVATAGGAITLVGDPDQHGSVDVGGLFRRLCAERGAGLVSLVENNRQQDHVERLAVAEYREGHVADALGRYDQAGKIVRSRTAGESFDAMVADWYAARLHGHADPMIAGPNSLRRALNDRARALLKRSGDLHDEPLVVAGREFMVGDEVVARRNDRRLRADGSRDFVKNGSTGTVIEIDKPHSELVVRFDREGTIRVPRAYLCSGRLEHGYARTTYGVQGATHDLALYHPTDLSSFEEGYVALTRARGAARIYLVDGPIPAHDDGTGHAPLEARPFGTHEVAQALTRRRSRYMAADASEHLAAVACELQGTSLAGLARRRCQLDEAMRAAPPDTSDLIASTSRTLDAIRTRIGAWSDLLAQASPDDNARVAERARATLHMLERARTHTEQRLSRALEQRAQRVSWLDEHAELVAEHQLALRAEHARETQIRVAAPESIRATARALLGPEPQNQRARLAWRCAVESIALYDARHGIRPGSDGGTAHEILGERPRRGRAARDYAQTMGAVTTAIAAIEPPEVAAELDVAS